MVEEPRMKPWMNVAAIALLAIVAVHSTLVAMYNLPFNYLHERAGTAPSTYINPYFNQAWGFFAPDPGGSFNDVLFRFARVENGARAEVGPWLRVSDILPPNVERPNNPLSTVRAIFFGAEMISVKRIGELRTLAKAHPESSVPIAVDQLPLPTRPLARVLMSLGCRTSPVVNCAGYNMQIAFEERGVPRFADRFMNVSKRREPKPPTVFVLPWIEGETIAGAVDDFSVEPAGAVRKERSK